MRTATILLMSVLLVVAAPAFAQITLTQSSFPTTGSHVVGEITSATFDLGSGGANQTWTFGGYTWDFILDYELVDAATSPYTDNFPTSDRCVRITGGDAPLGGTYMYYRMESDGMYFLGAGNSNIVLAVSNQPRVIVFPCTYQTNWTCVIKWSLLGASHTDSSLNTIDGWGTLDTPFLERSALRWFSHTWYTIHIPLQPPTTTEHVSYSWLSSEGEELLVITSEDGVTDPNFTTGDLEMTGVPSAVEPVRGPVAQKFAVGQNYPNPFNPTTMLPVDMAREGRVTLDIYDETGRLVSHQDFELSVGHHDLTVNGQNWATGAYFARILSAAQSQTVKMQLIK